MNEKFEKGIKDLDEIIKINRSSGNYDYDPYMFGFANGLIMARSCFASPNAVVDFIEKPKCWLSDEERNIQQELKVLEVLRTLPEDTDIKTVYLAAWDFWKNKLKEQEEYQSTALDVWQIANELKNSLKRDSSYNMEENLEYIVRYVLMRTKGIASE